MKKPSFTLRTLLLLACTLFATKNIYAQSCLTITTIAGSSASGGTGDGGAATAAGLLHIGGLCMDAAGNIYVADGDDNKIRKISTSGIITTVAGNGTAIYAGDGRAATAASLNRPTDVKLDRDGNLIIADYLNHAIRKVNSSGIISTIVGTGTSGFSGDGGAATAAYIYQPQSITFDASGNLYFADEGNSRVRKVTTSGIISTIAGGGTSTSDGVAATTALFGILDGVVFDLSGNLLVSDERRYQVRKVTPSGLIYTVAGTGVSGSTGDGGPATAAKLNFPARIGIDAYGNIFIPDYNNNKIRKINTSGVISTFIGTGTAAFSGDGGPASAAQLHFPTAVMFDSLGNMYISDGFNNRVRKVYNAASTTPPITGPSTLCVGDSITLYDSISGGTWSSSNTSVAIPTGGGSIYGVAAGSAIITYTTTSSCGASYATFPITVTSGGSLGAISGPPTVCVGASATTYTNATSGGTWRLSNTSIATISPAGILYVLAPGTDTIIYTAYGCGGTPSSVYYPITILSAPTAGSISGPTTACVGTPITLTASVSGGTWSVLHPSMATISGSGTTGTMTGVTTGTETVSYTVTNSCGTASATTNIVISAGASTPGPITGTTTVCPGGSSTLSDATSGGTWSSSTSSIATVNSTTGAVTGVSAGTCTITYSVSSTCGSAYATTSFTVTSATATPASITGASSVCVGASTTLADATSGGIWSTSNASIASVNTAGVVTGVTAGSATITYTVSGSCGSAYAIKAITVNTSATVAAITGISTLCLGTNTTLSDATPGGVWSTSNSSIASVSTTGIVYGMGAGTATITYSVVGSCGTTYSVLPVTVTSVPSVVSISGSSSMCTGTSGTYTDATVGGVWSSTTPAVATVSAAGVVTAIATGTTTLSYTVTNTCGAAAATKVITVSSIPSAGTISGASSVCSGLATTLTSSVSGGLWSSSLSAVATVSGSGVVTGIGAGSATITYTITTACGSASSTFGMVVNPAPNAGTLSGTTTVCVGATSPLTSTASGGTWSSAAPAIASVSTAGIVRGVAAGTAVVSYTVSNSCGTAYVTRTMTVNPAASAGIISGPSSVCTSSSISLSDATTGGVWTSSNTSVASVSSTGVVTGIAAGTASISYTVTNSCGSATAGYVISVSAPPSAGAITGSTTICSGTTSTYTESVTGGSWASSSTAVATVSTAGVVTGVSVGTFTLSYVVSNSCATIIATKSVSVTASSTAGTISGLSSVCVGSTITLTSSGTAGGSWSSSNTSIATTTGGVVRGVAGGTVNITYSVTSACGTVSSFKTVTVTAAPTVTAITGASSICAGTTSTYTDGTAGGGWISSNTAVATVNSSGIVTGVAAGTITLTYFITNSCGTATTTKSVAVNTLSAGVISGATSLAVGASTTYSNTITGGTWSSSNTSLATVVSTSGFTTGVAAGVDTIKYTITNACGAAVARKVVSITASKTNPGIETSTGINVYPNPTNGLVNVTLPCENCSAVAVVTDVTGKIIVAQTVEAQAFQFDLSQYAAGTYFLQVNMDGTLYSAKVIVK